MPTDKTSSTGRRSFNASMENSRRDRRGVEPGTVWGARALEALKPWEENDLCLSHAVAQALETAYLEGQTGAKPRWPGDEIATPANPAACEDCVQPVKHITRHAGNLHADGVDRTPVIKIRKPGVEINPRRAGPQPIVRRPVPAISNNAAARRHFENHPLAEPPKQDEYLEGIMARIPSRVSKAAPIIRGTKDLVADAQEHRARTGERPTFADLAKRSAKVVEQPPLIEDLVDIARRSPAVAKPKPLIRRK